MCSDRKHSSSVLMYSAETSLGATLALAPTEPKPLPRRQSNRVDVYPPPDGSLVRHSSAILLTALLACCALMPSALDAGQAPAARPVPRVTAVRATGPVAVDGRLDEADWQKASPATDFLQRDPDEGKPATERTEVRILYDDTAIYVGARMFDSEPSKIARRLTRRDGDTDGIVDWIVVGARSAARPPHRRDVHRDGGRARSATASSTTTRTRTRRGTRSGTPPCRSTTRAGAPRCASRSRSCASRRPSSRCGACTRSAMVQRKNEESWWSFIPKKDDAVVSRAGRAGWTGRDPQPAAPRGPALRHRARRVAGHGRGGRSVQRRADGRGGGRPRPEVGRHEQHDARRDGEPRLRAGRGGPGRRQPDGVRDLLRREAPVLHRGLAGVQPVRPQRRQRLHGIQPHEPDALLLAPHRPRAAGRGAGRVRGPAVGDDDPRRGEADRQDEPRVDGELHRRRHRARVRGHVDRTARRPHSRSNRSPTTWRDACAATSDSAPGSACWPRPSTAASTTRRSPRSCPAAPCVARRRRPLLLHRQARLRRHRQPLGQPRRRVHRARWRGCSGRRPATTSAPTRRTSRSIPTPPTSRDGACRPTSTRTTETIRPNASFWAVSPGLRGERPRLRDQRRPPGRPPRAGAAEADARHASAAAAASSSRSGTPGTSPAIRSATATSRASPTTLHNYWSFDVTAHAGRWIYSDRLTRGGPIMRAPGIHGRVGRDRRRRSQAGRVVDRGQLRDPAGRVVGGTGRSARSRSSRSPPSASASAPSSRAD